MLETLKCILMLYVLESDSIRRTVASYEEWRDLVVPTIRHLRTYRAIADRYGVHIYRKIPKDQPEDVSGR